MTPRWSDDKLDVFYQEFHRFSLKFEQHIGDEAFEQKQQQELYTAVFQKEDLENNKPPGLLQMTMRMCNQLHDMRVWQDRQKTFVGGVVFTISSAWFFITDAGPMLLGWFKKL